MKAPGRFRLARRGAGAGRPSATVALSGALGLVGAPAAAAGAGPFFEAGAGLGWTSGHVEFERAYPPWPAEPSQPGGVAFGSDATAGPLLALALEPGWALTPALAVGVSAEAELAFFQQSARLLYSSVDFHAAGTLGAFVGWRFARPAASGAAPAAAPGVELRLRLGWCGASTGGSTDDLGAADNVFDFEALGGPAAGLGLGWRGTSGWGFEARGRLAWLGGAHTAYQPLSFVLGASWSGWE